MPSFAGRKGEKGENWDSLMGRRENQPGKETTETPWWGATACQKRVFFFSRRRTQQLPAPRISLLVSLFFMQSVCPSVSFRASLQTILLGICESNRRKILCWVLRQCNPVLPRQTFENWWNLLSDFSRNSLLDSARSYNRFDYASVISMIVDRSWPRAGLVCVLAAFAES